MCEEAGRDGGTWAYQAMAGEEATVDTARQMRRHGHGGDGREGELVAGGPARGKGVEPGADLCRGGSGAPVHVEASGVVVVAVAVGVGGGHSRGGGGMMVVSQMAIQSLGFFWVVTSICCRACAGDRTVEARLGSLQGVMR